MSLSWLDHLSGCEVFWPMLLIGRFKQFAGVWLMDSLLNHCDQLGRPQYLLSWGFLEEAVVACDKIAFSPGSNHGPFLLYYCHL